MQQPDSQLTKVRFLMTELAQTQQELAEMRHLLELNKEIIRTFNRDSNLQITSAPTTAASKRLPSLDTKQDSEPTFQALFNQMQEENEQLYKLNDLLTKQRDEARSQALVYEQIAESAQSHEIDQIIEVQNQAKQLKRKLEEKDSIIASLDQQLQIHQQKKKYVTKQVISPTLESMHMHVQIENLQRKVMELLQERDKLKEEKHALLVMNHLRHEAPIASEHHEASHSSSDLPDIDDLNDSELQIELPTKIHNKVFSPKSIPKLDLAKAQKVQKLSIKKQEKIDEEEEIMAKQQRLKKQIEMETTNKLAQQKAQTPSNANMQMMFTSPNKLFLQWEQTSEQLKLCQKDLNQARMSLQDELLTSRNLEMQCDEMKRRLEDSEHRNELLIMSQVKYEQKWGTINSLFHEYYNFFLKHRDKENETAIQQSGSVQPQVLSPRALQGKRFQLPTPLLEVVVPDIRPVNASNHVFDE